nr:oxygenase MpaB family protein [Bradyrhizobium sp. CCBAU 11386]
MPPFSVEKRERYWAKSRLFGAIFGLTSSELPTHWDSFAAYNAAMMQSDTLSVSTAAREVAQDLRRFTTMLRPPRWYQTLSAGLPPDRLRTGFGFALDERDREAAERAVARILRIYPKMPTGFATSAPTRKLKRDCSERRS